MSEPHLVAVVRQVPLNHLSSLRELLREHPSIQYFTKGWVDITVAMVGPPAALQALAPELRAWDEDDVWRNAF